MATKSKLPLDDFVQSIRPDPSKKGETLKVLCGFLGKSSEKDSVRVYFDEALNQFVDFKESDIVHAVKLTPEQSPLGGCKIWVRSSATYVFGDPEKKENRPKANFMQGDLVRNFQAGNVGIPSPFDPQIRTIGDPACNFATAFGPSCGFTCENTCLLVSCFRTCDNTCFRISCFDTCNFQQSCNITCNNRTCITCFRTCNDIICGADTLNINCLRTRILCPVSNLVCQLNVQTAQCQVDTSGLRNPVQGTGFEDFNPLAGM